MTLTLGATAWVTPLGSGVAEVWRRLIAGEKAAPETIADEQTGQHYLVHRVPPEAVTGLPPHARLRRASAISRFATAAGLAALADYTGPLNLDRTALVFAISNGGVIYTRRFYAEIVRSGAQAASPLLFPETVFNAPASHLAAILGINGASYTVVGDGAVGILALKLAEDLLALPGIDVCLVVGAEEIDPLVCEAYRRWHLLRDPSRPQSDRGMVVSEGAGAVLLHRGEGQTQIEKINAGTNFFRRAELAEKLRRVARQLGHESAVCIGAANGTFVDQAEQSAIGASTPFYSPKSALGDSVGASVLWQLITAAQVLRTQRLPRIDRLVRTEKALVLACGVNQQLGGLILRLAAPNS
jgi:3-oxoacyl-(acyl-carrier-protein) synthase